MVAPTLFALALLAVSHAVEAAPTAEVAGSITSTFSFQDWVEGIIANPNGNNLTPAEAVETFYASANATTTSASTKARSLIQKRFFCNTIPNTEAYVSFLLRILPAWKFPSR